ncbi:MAG TPA: hypothetical protein VKA76_01480 [Gammaproteobacteria bacterium]|nr:hypothetical protein [Gammaproteobacteria bacterium]
MRILLSLLLLLGASAPYTPVLARDAAPWGHAKVLHIHYQPQKVVYDVTTGKKAALSDILDRLALLDSLYGSDPFAEHIVVVLHGHAIPFFALKNYHRYRNLMKRAEGLTQNGTIHFRMCQASAEHHYGLKPKDIEGFVTMVPMADAEIVRLEHEGYAYMR